MAKKSTMFSDEQINEILELYKSGEKTSVIALKFGTSSSYISHIANTNGLRRLREYKTTNGKMCPKCHKKIETKGARFCPFCGTDIRSSKDIAVEKLINLRKLVLLVPGSCQAEFEEAITLALKELTQ